MTRNKLFTVRNGEIIPNEKEVEQAIEVGDETFVSQHGDGRYIIANTFRIADGLITFANARGFYFVDRVIAEETTLLADPYQTFVKRICAIA